MPPPLPRATLDGFARAVAPCGDGNCRVLASSRARRHTVCAFLLVLFLQPAAFAQTPVAYRLSFPEAAHHLMQVEATFTTVPAGPLELRMSRSSPGRYALHEFAKNVFDVRITDEAGKSLEIGRAHV